MQIDVTDMELARALFAKVQEYIGEIDDAGCDWYTEGEKVYICDRHWLVCEDKRVAALVNAANVLMVGKILTLKDAEGEV